MVPFSLYGEDEINGIREPPTPPPLKVGGIYSPVAQNVWDRSVALCVPSCLVCSPLGSLGKVPIFFQGNWVSNFSENPEKTDSYEQLTPQPYGMLWQS